MISGLWKGNKNNKNIMYERKEKGGNCYYPSFFYTFLDIPDDPQYLARYPLDERTEAYFLHEYIHNLQDLTTPSGYARIETIVDQVKWAVEEAGKRRNLRIPLDPSSTWLHSMKPNAHCLRIAKGEMKKKTNLGADVEFGSPLELVQTDELTPVKNGKQIRVKAITTFRFEDNNHIKYEYNIGELAISESMAYLIENYIYPGALNDPPDFPYKVVKNVVGWKCQRADNDLILVAICDVCLMYSFPGIAFYNLIQFLESYEGEITPEFIYIYGLGGDMCHKMGVNFWQEQLDKTNKMAIDQVRDYFNHKCWNNTQWALTTSLISAYLLRKKKPNFIVDIMKGGKICSNRAFQDILSLIGCMAIHTAQNQLFYFSPKDASGIEMDPDWFVSLFQLYIILFSKEAIEVVGDDKFLRWRCYLKEWCQDSFLRKGLPDITSTSGNCIQSPWLNATDELMAQCSFGRIWAAYEFRRVKLKPGY